MRTYRVRNVVATNDSAPNHGAPAVLKVDDSGSSVRITHWRDGGANEYGVAIDRAKELADVVAQLISYCPKKSLPKLMEALGTVMVADE